jgi:hypothetical protein
MRKWVPKPRKREANDAMNSSLKMFLVFFVLVTWNWIVGCLSHLY